jgi:O-antigen ligase
LSSIISKSGFEFFAALLVLLYIAGLDWKKFLAREKLAFGIFLLYPIAIVCGFFSLGHGQSALHVATAWPWPLIFLPTMLVMNRPKDIQIVKYCLAVSLAVACAKCFYIFGADFGGVFKGDVRVHSFWDISRWGLFSALALIFLLAKIAGEKKILSSKINWALIFLAFADLACVFLANNRGPWLAFGISMLLFLVLYPKIWKCLVPIALLGVAALFFSNGLSSRISSIGAVETKQGDLVSKNPSNQGRLSMWKVAGDFYKEQPLFGTGFENSVLPLTEFLNRQTEEYRQKYTLVEFSYSDQHSSILTLLVQMGVIFSLVFWGLVFFSGLTLLRRWRQTKALFDATLLAAVTFHLVLCFFYTSFLSFEIVSFIPLLVMKGSNDGTA